MLHRIDTLAGQATRAQLVAMNIQSRHDALERKLRNIRNEALAKDVTDEEFRAWVMGYTAEKS